MYLLFFSLLHKMEFQSGNRYGSQILLPHSINGTHCRKRQVVRMDLLIRSLLFFLFLYPCIAFSGGQVIQAGTLEISAPTLLDWRVSVSSYKTVVLVSPDSVQVLSLERIHYTADNSNYATVDYCYICVRPSGRPPDRVNYAEPDITWSSPCLQVNFVQNCTLFFSRDGNLALQQGSRNLWQTNTSGRGVRSMRLDDSGNLVLFGAGLNETVWQSFNRQPDPDGFSACDQVAQVAYFLGSFAPPGAFVWLEYVLLGVVCVVGHIIFHSG